MSGNVIVTQGYINDLKEQVEAYKRDYLDALRIIAAAAASQPHGILRIQERDMVLVDSDNVTLERYFNPANNEIRIKVGYR
jgi:hypothetical protein